MNINEVIKEAQKLDARTVEKDVVCAIIVAQAIEKLADAIISNKESRIIPLVNPKDRRMD